jgi:adenylate kinase family enzyme
VRRLQVHQDKTVPLLEYYADRERMFTVAGGQSADAVHEDMSTA